MSEEEKKINIDDPHIILKPVDSSGNLDLNNNVDKNKDANTDKYTDKDKVPNSLIIYIKTRIPNFYKMTFEPFMSVPSSKSHTVYFDPLVKYYDWPVRDVPRYAPKNSIYTQFFEASEFDTMINRILSDFRYMQKPRTLEQSFDQGIIDNNIQITLNTLFRTNNLFYLNKKPYTIVNKRWKTGAWDIDKKPIQKLLSQFSHLNLTSKQLEEEAKKEEDDIPESIRQGNLASGNLAKKAAAEYVRAGLDKAAAASKPENTTTTPTKKTFLLPENLNETNSYIKKLFTLYLQDNPPINYSDLPDLANDTLTLSLLINPEQFKEFIEENPESDIIELYQNYMTAKEKLLNTEKNFKEGVNKIATYKTQFNKNFRIYQERLEQYIKNKSLSKEKKIQLVKDITLGKIEYMKLLFELLDIINDIYSFQKEYFNNVKLLLIEFKKEYATIIKYPDTPELAIKCIDFDINTITALLGENPENPYSISYSQNFKLFKEFYDNLYKIKRVVLNPQINYSQELQKYLDNPYLLKIEKNQYELYDFKLLLFYAYNQLDIWVLYFKATQIFSKFIQSESAMIIDEANQALVEYEKKYPDASLRQNFLDTLEVDGIRSDPVDKKSKSSKLQWYLVKSDGTRCDVVSSLQKEQEQLYISTLKTNVISYDAIVLYIYILEIICLRQHKLYIAEENVNHLNLENSMTIQQYYESIEKSKLVKDSSEIRDIYIPQTQLGSLLGDASKLNDPEVLKTKLLTNDKHHLIFKERLKSIQTSRKQLDNECEKIHDAIVPTVSSTDLLNYCKSILNVDAPIIPPYTFRSSHWLEIDIKNYDLKNTQNLLFNMSAVIKDAYYDFIIDDTEKDPNDYLDWIVYKNGQTTTIDSLLASICDALNGQLNLGGDDTTNKYSDLVTDTRTFKVGDTVEVNYRNKPDIWLPATIVKNGRQYVVKYDNGEEEKDIPKDRIRFKDDPLHEIIGKRRFTIPSLKRLLVDSGNPTTTQDIIQILQSVLEIKFIVFEMFSRDDTTNIQIGDIVSYTDTTSTSKPNIKKYRVININLETNQYTLFNGKKTLTIAIDDPNIRLSTKNIPTNFRIQCYPTHNVYDSYIYLLSVKNTSSIFTFELVRNTKNNLSKYVYTHDEIPVYILYLIYNNCQRFQDKSDGFDTLELNKLDEKIKTIETTDGKEQIKNLNKQIASKFSELENFTEKEKLTNNEEVQKHILEIDIEELENKKKEIANSSDLKYEKYVPTEEHDYGYYGGGKSSEKYMDYSNPYPPSYQSNPYSSLEYQQNGLQPPGYGYVPPPYPIYPRRGYHYPPYKYNRSYQVASNKAKETKSKLAFYIEIELDLYPGKSANMLQRSAVRCQGIFERIREAYSEIFGYQYRPGAMTEAYAYQYQNNNNNKNNNNNTKKNKYYKNNKTQKNRY